MDPTHRVHRTEVVVEGPPTSAFHGQPVDDLVTDDDAGRMAHPTRVRQLCPVHLVHLLGALLPKEGVSLFEREAILGPARGLLAPRRNSVELHRLRREWWASTDRVRIPLTELEALAQRLDRAMCPRSARAIRRDAKALVVFAEVAAHGIRLPATSNEIERAIGMTADCCKRKWARWGRGLHNLRVMWLARKTRRGT